MIRRLLLCMVCGVFTMASAQKAPVWKDASVNQQNREPRRAHFFGFESEDKAKGDKEASERFLSMEGKWKFNFVKNHQDAPQGFYALKYDDSKWVDFPVPGLFEMEGYGDKIYKNMGYAWCTTFKNNPPYVGETNNYTGSYRRTFDLPQNWKGQEVYFHVGSATSNLSVWVNGKYVGYSEDSKVAAEFNITKYLKPGKNLIAMQIMRWCDGSYLEDQDFWRFTGIAREVYLYATPKVHVQDITIGQDYQQGNGQLSVDVKLAGKAAVEAKLFDAALGIEAYPESAPRTGAKRFEQYREIEYVFKRKTLLCYLQGFGIDGKVKVLDRKSELTEPVFYTQLIIEAFPVTAVKLANDGLNA